MSPKKPAKQKALPSPHDGLFKTIMEEEVVAREFLEHYLPTNFKALIDLSKITIEKESFVEETLKRRLSDVIYSVQTKDGDEAFIYVLIENQSSNDYWIAFRLWKYMMLLCERHKNKNDDKLPLIVPLVFYNGPDKYNAPLNLWDLFAAPELAKKLMTEDYQLINLQSMPDDEIEKEHHLGMLQYFMKHAHERDMLKVWEQFLKQFEQAILLDKETGYIYIKHFLWYTERKVPEDRQEEFGRLIIEHLPKENGENIMRTIAQKYIEEGEVRGEARSKLEIAKNLLKAGLSIELIANATGLLIGEIQKLKSLS